MRVASAGIAMNTTLRLTALATGIASTLTAGCSLLMPSPAPYVPQADQVGVYEASPPGQRDYRFVKRLWVEPWQSAIRVPRYPTVEAGAADLRNQALALGGDAVVNFGCYHSSEKPDSDYYCNGTAISFVP